MIEIEQQNQAFINFKKIMQKAVNAKIKMNI